MANAILTLDYLCLKGQYSLDEIHGLNQTFQTANHPITIGGGGYHTCLVQPHLILKGQGSHFLVAQQALADRVVFYQDGVKLEEMSLVKNFTERKIFSSLPTIKLAHNSSDKIWILIQSQHPLWLNFVLWNEKDYLSQTSHDNFVHGGFVIFCLGFAFINLIQFLSTATLVPYFMASI